MRPDRDRNENFPRRRETPSAAPFAVFYTDGTLLIIPQGQAKSEKEECKNKIQAGAGIIFGIIARYLS